MTTATAPPAQEVSSRDAALRSLDLRAGWAALKREPWSFWLLCFYFFVEYVRPQAIYRSLDVLPWGRAALALTVLAFLLEGLRSRRFQALDGLLILFSVVWFLSGILALFPEAAQEWAYVFYNWLVLYYLVTHIVTTERRFFIFLAFFLLWGLKLSQHGARLFILSGGVPSWGVRGPSGWFQNPGELAIQMLILVPMSFHFVMGLREHLPRRKLWGLLALLPGTAALTIMVSNSRGSQLALAVVLLLMIAQSRHRVRGLVLGGVFALALWAVVPETQRERFQTMGDDRTSVARTTYWEHGLEIARDYPVLGIGYRNWLPYYQSYYNPRGELPHNIFIEAAAELGYTGFVALLLLMGGTLVANWRTRRLARSTPEWGPFLRGAAFGLDGALIGYAVAGFFVTVLYYPYLWVTLAFSAALLEVTRQSAARARAQAAETTHRAAASGAPAADPSQFTASRPPEWRSRRRVG